MTRTFTCVMTAVLSAALLVLPKASLAQTAQAGSGQDEAVRGVNPADNLTKLELLPKLTVLSENTSMALLTLKYDRAIQGKYGLNLELPLARFESPSGSSNGFGDLNLRGRYQFKMGRWTGIVGLEGVLPIATGASLGSGKFQLNPTVVGVYPFSRKVFMALIAKHFISVAGKAEREDILYGQYRTLVAYSSPKGWWALLDPQLFIDYKNHRGTEWTAEFECGKMVGRTVGAWVRAGFHVAGAWQRQDWTVSGGLRFISF